MSTTIPQFVTLQDIAAHTGKALISVRRGLKAAGMMPKRTKGVRGYRIDLREANRFVSRQWPGTPLIPSRGDQP